MGSSRVVAESKRVFMRALVIFVDAGQCSAQAEKMPVVIVLHA